jgi:pimeloyl-ACP methyl ester carboxylesterase
LTPASQQDLFQVLDANRGSEHAVGPALSRRPTPWRRALSAGGAVVDRGAVRAIERIFLSADAPDLSGDVRARIDATRATYAAAGLLARPELYFRPSGLPAGVRRRRLGRLRGGEHLELTFPSAYRTFDLHYQPRFQRFEANRVNVVRAWLHRDPGHPAVICIHPWCSGYLALEERIFGARALYRMGLDVALFTMPFHGRRTPRQARFPGQLFPSRNLRRTNEAFGQAVADLRALMGWLRQRGSGQPGVLGISLGGYTSALLAGLQSELAFAVPIAAPCSMADVLWFHGRRSPGRREAEEVGFTLEDFRGVWAIHCPLSHPVRLPRERLLLVWLEGDHVVPRVHQLALWRHLGQPELLTAHGGHVLQTGHGAYMRRVRAWLRRRVL